MEQIFEVFGVNWKLLLIQLVNFGVLLFLLRRYLYAPLLHIIKERQERIAKGVRDAEAAEALLRSAETERVNRITEATRESNGIIESARGNAKKEERAILKDAQEKSERLVIEAKRAAEAEKERAIAESKVAVAKMAVLAAEKILHEKTA